MIARRRKNHRKPEEVTSLPGVTPVSKELPVRDSRIETVSRPSPAGSTAKSQGSLPVAVILDIIAQEYSEDAHEDILCRVALRLVEESGLLESYRARWDEEVNAPNGLRSSLLFDRNQCLELINYYKGKGNMDKLQQEKDKLVQIEGRLLLGGGVPTRITNEDLDKLEEFIRESGF
jgi:hypothetical protein